jgi:ABC-type spermidine/putrescine transport system permease subunit II
MGRRAGDANVTRGRALSDRLLDPSLGANAALAFAFLYVPMAVLVAYSFSGARLAAVWGGFSTKWYGELFKDERMLAALANSVVIGLVVALLSTVLGTLTAMGLERRADTRTAALGDAAVTLPIAMPDIVQGIAMLMTFSFVWFAAARALFGAEPALGRTTVILAHTAWAFAYVTVVVRARLAGMSRALDEAAADLGATPFVAFRRVTLPLIWPAVLGGFLLAFTLSLDEFVITFFTSGTDGGTLPVYIWSEVRSGVTPKINALAALLVVASVALVTLSALLQRRPR